MHVPLKGDIDFKLWTVTNIITKFNEAWNCFYQENIIYLITSTDELATVIKKSTRILDLNGKNMLI